MNNNDKQYVYFMRFADKNGVNKLDKIGIGTNINERKSTNLRLARSFNKEVSEIKHVASIHLSSLGDAVEAEVQLKKLIEPATIKDKNEWFKPNEDTTQSINSFLLHLSENKEILDNPERREVFSFLSPKEKIIKNNSKKLSMDFDIVKAIKTFNNSPVAIGELLKKYNIPRSTMKDYINRAIKENKIKPVGKGSDTKYIIK